MPAPMPVAGYPSMRQAMLAVLRDAIATHPTGLTVIAWRTLAEARWPITAARFGAQVQSLRTTGLVVVAGGRVGHQRYLPADVAVAPAADAGETDFALQVLEALRSAEQQAGRPVTVAAVRAALPVDVVPPHPNAVRRALLTLSAPRRRGVAALQKPVFRRTDDGAGGHPITTWSTAPIPDPVASLPSRTEALRQLIVRVTEHVGMPLQANWLAAWGETLGVTTAWPAPWRRGLRRALTDAARRSTTRITALTVPGARAPRFVVADRMSPIARAAAHLEDFALRADLAQELILFRGLAHRTRTHRALQPQLAHRQRVVAACLAEIVGEHSIDAVMACWRRSMEIRTAPITPGLRTEWVVIARQLQAVEEWITMHPIAQWSERPPVCGEAGLMTPEAADGWARAAVAAGELSLRRAHTVMGAAAGMMVDGELRYDALRAVAALLPYTATPRMHQQILALLDARGTLDRSAGETGPLERFLATGSWDGPPLGATARMRLRAGAWFGILER